MNILKLAGILLFVVLFALPALAQTPTAGQEPEAQASRYQKEIERRQRELEEKRVRPPRAEVEEEKPKPSGVTVTFTLASVAVTGSTIFKEADLSPTYQPYLNRTVTFEDLDKITENIKAKYREKGYLTTNVYVPEQEIRDGNIEIRVLEGKMGSLNVEGNRFFSTRSITRYFHTKKDELLNINVLQRDLLRLNQNPDLEVKSVIGAGKEAGTTDITLKAEERFPYHLGGGVDNHGSRLTGKYRTFVLFWSSNFTGNFDVIFVNSLLSEDAFGESVSYALPITTVGTKLGIDASYFELKLGQEYLIYDITGKTQIYSPYLSQELYLSEDLQVTGKAGIDIKCIKKKMHTEVTAKEDLRLPYAGLDIIGNDDHGQTSFTPRFVFGTSGFLGASRRNDPLASRTDTGGFFFKYEHTLERLQRMCYGSYLDASFQFQIASHTLPSAEQFQLGGMNSVRGYPEGDYLADLGGSLSVDWIFPMYLIPADWKLPCSETPLRRQIEPVVFFDIGGGKLNKTYPGEKREKFLMGAGGGLRVNFKRNLSMRFEWAGALGDDPTSGAGPSTFYLTVQANI
ncbi:MAG: POTRA domain-containing protein [Candidatus Omnitrophota bacterium]